MPPSAPHCNQSLWAALMNIDVYTEVFRGIRWLHVGPSTQAKAFPGVRLDHPNRRRGHFPVASVRVGNAAAIIETREALRNPGHEQAGTAENQERVTEDAFQH